MTRHHVLVVHDDKQPHIRIREFEVHTDMLVYVATNARYLKTKGYAYEGTRTKGGQETFVYRAIGQPTVYMTVQTVGDSPTRKG